MWYLGDFMLLRKYFKLAGRFSVVLVFLLPIAALIEISVSYLLQIITDSVSGHVNITYSVLVILVISYMFIDAIVFFCSSFLEQVVLNKIDSKIRLQLAQSLLQERTGLGFSTQTISTQYYNDFTNTLDVLHNDYLQGSINAYKQLCQFVIAMILSVMIQPIFSLIIVLLCLPALIVPLLQRRVLKDNKNQVLRASENYTHGLQNIINGIRTIQIFSIQPLMRIIFQNKNIKLLQSQNKDQLKRKQVGGISQLLDNVLYLGTWIVGIYFVMNKSVTLGQLVAFSQLMIFIAEPIQSASGLLGDIVGGKQAAKKIDFVVSKNDDDESALTLNHFEEIRYANMSFKDNNTSVLNNIDLSFQANKRYLVVGKSGSGKSSLINVPFSPNTTLKGNVFVNSKPLQSYESASVFQHVGLLEQRSYVFDETIKNNLSLFNSDVSSTQMINTLRRVGLIKYASDDGLNVRVDDQGNSLSGGERKRLTLGRILLKKYDFVFFDEPLTGLDPKTSQDVIDILLQINNFGWAIVTHQYNESLFSSVDEIIVVSEGKIEGIGQLNDDHIQECLRQLNLL